MEIQEYKEQNKRELFDDEKIIDKLLLFFHIERMPEKDLIEI